MEGTTMSNDGKREYLEAIRERYHMARKPTKKIILDEFCRVCGYHRKYAIRLLKRHRARGASAGRKRPGRRPQYHHPDVLTFLTRLWKASNLACGKRLKAMLPLWLPHDPNVSPEARVLLQSISAATIDRLLAPVRRCYTQRGLATTKPGSLLKQHIPIKTNQWDEHLPGFLEADTVAHCGSSMAGMFVFTLNTVDIATGWTEQRALWGKGELGTVEALERIEAALPFRLRGFDCDNGSEFINWTILHHYTERKRPVAYTRSREYQKNDNAHIEGKNWTHVRQYLGYQRFEHQQLTNQLNELYTSEWRLLLNFFLPSTKLIEKRRFKSRTIKTHDFPQTPLARVLASKYVAPQQKRKLKTLFATLNPFQLQQTVARKVRAILDAAAHLGEANQ